MFSVPVSRQEFKTALRKNFLNPGRGLKIHMGRRVMWAQNFMGSSGYKILWGHRVQNSMGSSGYKILCAGYKILVSKFQKSLQKRFGAKKFLGYLWGGNQLGVSHHFITARSELVHIRWVCIYCLIEQLSF